MASPVCRWDAVFGGWGPERRAFRERIRFQAGERFAAGEKTAVIAKDLRVSLRSVERWRRAWREGGVAALRSTGPAKPCGAAGPRPACAAPGRCRASQSSSCATLPTLYNLC
ncbi:helix-turn-helix domain-containing protein [Streptomyces sp. NPDC040750]|uniref:helix-turn-helix domain-containing protein n=1 Tax=Streptomyces sp. NPDC040750 TaxID=3154491 RepID=UPI0033D0C5FC